MAGFFQQNLKSVGTKNSNAASRTGPTLRDFKHASKVFVTNGFGNSPKLKYLFHVYFDINSTEISAAGAATFPEEMIPGLLVKNISLPKFTLNLAELNQYNRKRYVQTKITYDPVNIVFHDDNDGSMRQVWYNYFKYYYNDVTTAERSQGQLQLRNIYQPEIGTDSGWGYNNNDTTSASAVQPKPNFFNTIKIYGFDQHNFCLYTLINPIVDRWEHDTYDYYQGNGIMENRMTVRYETVTYEEGQLDGGEPDTIVSGFGTKQYYDREISPITPRNGNRTVMGKNGIANANGGSQGSIGLVQQQALNARTNTIQTAKVPSTRLTAKNNKILEGALGISDTSSRGIFNIPAPGANGGGRVDMEAGSENIEYTQAPAISNLEINPALGGI